MKKSISMVLVALFLFTGCGTVQVPASAIDSAVTGTKDTVVNFSDEQTAREAIVASTLKNRDNQYAKAHKESGLNLEFELVDFAPGVKAYMPKKITYRESPKFDTPLPTKPAESPGWRTAENITKTITLGVVGYKGVQELGSFLAGLAAGKGSQDVYNGPVNFVNSKNNAGKDITNGGYNGPLRNGDDITEIPEGAAPPVTP